MIYVLERSLGSQAFLSQVLQPHHCQYQIPTSTNPSFRLSSSNLYARPILHHVPPQRPRRSRRWCTARSRPCRPSSAPRPREANRRYYSHSGHDHQPLEIRPLSMGPYLAHFDGLHLQLELHDPGSLRLNLCFEGFQVCGSSGQDLLWM